MSTEADTGELVPEQAPPRVPWYRRQRVHLILGVIVSILAALWVAERATNGVRANLDARLLDAGAGTDAALVTLEAEQLSAVRAVSFTAGVGSALANLRISTLNRLVTPIQGNADVPMVDVLLPDGRVVLAVRAKGAPGPVASRKGMPAIARALRDAHGPRGGRSAFIAVFRSGPTLVTIGPILDGAKAAGLVLAMTPLADALGRFSQEVGAALTTYDAAGRPLATTSAATPPPLEPTEARSLIAGGAVVTRYMHGREREKLGRLIVNHAPAAVLGVALEDNSWDTGRAVFILGMIGLVCAMAIVASFSLRVANRRWR